MKLKIVAVAVALLLPVLVVVVLARIAPDGRNSSVSDDASKPSPQANLALPINIPTDDVGAYDNRVPDTIEEARKLASARFAEISGLSQEQWDVERVKIAQKYPPEDIETARLHIKQRVALLDAMSEAEWRSEKKRVEIQYQWDALSEEEKEVYRKKDRERQQELMRDPAARAQ